MTDAVDPRFLALLVHRGLLEIEAMRAAVASGNPKEFLVQQGHVTPEQWDEWLRSEAGLRPSLTRYQLGDLLGEGGTARVFRAVDRKTKEEVALKVLKSDQAADRDSLGAFIRESKLLMELSSAHIVAGKRVAREGEIYFCAMDLIDGECLQDRVGDDRRIDQMLALKIVMQVGKALCHLHERGLVHRDIKPGNIMLTRDENAVLIDLGFALSEDRDQQGGAADDSDTTAGTVHYISPEQARGSGLDVRADIYSLGATLYHLVTGSLPFDGGSHEEVMAKQVLEALSGQAIRKLALSPQVHYFIEKMMAKEKEIRFQSPQELVTEIEQYLDQQERERAAEEEALKQRKSKRRLRRFM